MKFEVSWPTTFGPVVAYAAEALTSRNVPASSPPVVLAAAMCAWFVNDEPWAKTASSFEAVRVAAPSLVVTVTVYRPTAAYVCVRVSLRSAMPEPVRVDVVPSPQFQVHD